MKILPKKPFTWLVLVVLAYGYVAMQQENPEPVQKTNTADVAVKSKDGRGSLIEGPIGYIVEKIRETPEGNAAVDAYIQQAIKEKYGVKDISIISAIESKRITILDILIGKGDALKCGSTATIHYDGLVNEITTFESTTGKQKPITITIGDKQVVRGLENGILGMQKGGKRKIAVPPHLAYDDPDFKNDLVEKNKPVVFEVELVDLKNGAPPQNNVNIKSVVEGEGPEVFCKSKVSINYAVVENNNKAKPSKISFILGDNQAPIVFEKALIGMKVGGIRRIDVKPSMLELKEKNFAPDLIEVKNDKDITIEIELTAIE